MAAGSAGEGAGSNTELRWTFSRLACQSELEVELEPVSRVACVGGLQEALAPSVGPSPPVRLLL